MASLDNFSIDTNLNNKIRPEMWAFFIINFLSDVLNYPTFLIVCIVLDVITASELRVTLSRKIATNKQIDEAIFKSTLFVKLNAVCNFFQFNLI